MLIRSQNKKILVNTESIEVDHEAIFGQNIGLGVYKSDERTLEILNEIQSLQEDILAVKLEIKSPHSLNDKYDSLIYQMPEQ